MSRSLEIAINMASSLLSYGGLNVLVWPYRSMLQMALDEDVDP